MFSLNRKYLCRTANKSNRDSLPAGLASFELLIRDRHIRLLTTAGPGAAHRGLKGRGIASTSPYREPLLKFCNVHATHACEFFLSQESERVRNLFIALISADIADPLRKELMRQKDKLIAVTFARTDSGPKPAIYGLQIVDAVSTVSPEWLAQNQGVFDCLVKMWTSTQRQRRLEREEKLAMDHLRESKMLAECFLRYCQRNHEERAVLFTMLSIFSVRTLNDFTFIKDYYTDYIPANYSIQNRKAIVMYFLGLFKNPNFKEKVRDP